MALSIWKNKDGTWETITGDTRLHSITPFHMVTDVIISNTEVQHLINELAEAYIEKDISAKIFFYRFDDAMFGEKVCKLRYYIGTLDNSELNNYLLSFLEDISKANKFRVRAAHRNIFREILKDSYVNRLRKTSNSNLLNLKKFMTESELNHRDAKGQIRNIFKSYSDLIEKHLPLINLLEQGLAEYIVLESLGQNDALQIWDVLSYTREPSDDAKKTERVTCWVAPICQSKPDARLLTMPNIPHPLQGLGMQPRTIENADRWYAMRQKCYIDAHYKCQACGKDVSSPGKATAHEMFSYYYNKGEAVFERLVCLCNKCHKFIHSGRLMTSLKRGELGQNEVLTIIRHGFQLISNYNNNTGEKLSVYHAFEDAQKNDVVGDAISELIQKYDITFYRPVAGKKQASWGSWKIIYKGNEYYTPYKDAQDYNRQMQKQHPKQYHKEEPNE